MDTDLDPDEIVSFTCNICGGSNQLRAGAFHRESPDCTGCGSTPRFRGIIHALSLGLLKSSVPLNRFPTDRYLKGIGRSEWEVYASILEQKFSFTNTFYHQEPRLDITSDDWRNYTSVDFVICTEVFEHVLQPLDVGFRNLRQMLRKNGILVFSAPFTSSPITTEHFPGMTDFATCRMGEQWLVVSKKADGSYGIYDKNIVFHGGPGTVLEMRVFGQEDLIRQLRDAGFETQVLSEPRPEIGYYWTTVTDRPEIGYPGLHYIILCRAV